MARATVSTSLRAGAPEGTRGQVLSNWWFVGRKRREHAVRRGARATAHLWPTLLRVALRHEESRWVATR